MLKLFPKEFSVEKLNTPSTIFDGKDAFVAAVVSGDLNFVKFCFEKDAKTYQEKIGKQAELRNHEHMHKHAVIQKGPGILHKLLDSLSHTAQDKERAEVMIFLIQQGADVNALQPVFKKTVLERLEELPSKPFASEFTKDFVNVVKTALTKNPFKSFKS